ncbi:MAG: metal-dependent transcriptional regulator [Flavobacteriaceae bacterium]|nr:metal-dependent transcriptional regulator [Flavobacteriaceae bacterium]
MNIELSYTEENYLKAVFSLSIEKGNAVSTNQISKKLTTKASSVTDMIKKLAEKKLVDYKKYKGVSLTKKGREIAVLIVRNHRLWEVFLVEKLDFKWDEVHDLAEQLEHVKSKQLTDKLDTFLNFPTHDPHGDPIPDKYGNLNKDIKEDLSSIDEGVKCIIVGVRDSSSLFLKFLDNSNIKLGSKIKVVEKEDFDNSMLVEIGTKTLSLSNQITKNLFVKIIN